MEKSPYHSTYSFTIHPILSTYYRQWVALHWLEALLLFLVVYLFVSKDIHISFQFQERPSYVLAAIPQPAAQTTALFDKWEEALSSTTNKKRFSKHIPKAQNFYNLTFILNPDYAARKGIPASIVQEKRRVLQDYIDRYLKVAKEEQAIYKIPVSITLAQGLLESNAGDSRLAKESNNHFGIKCKSKCKGCTCKNYHDDDYYDMFRVFTTSWESYREHSILLSSSRYQHLKEYGNDYRHWAFGLKKAGYATDKKYAEKLIQIIQELRLYQYD